MHGPFHGCPKCVINDGFVGPIAELLAISVSNTHALHKPALALAAAANAATKVYAHAGNAGVRTMPDIEFAGCKEAMALMAHINGGERVTVAALVKMRADILANLANLVAGTDING